MAKGEERQPIETAEERAEHLVPGGDIAELAQHYEDDPAIQRLRARSVSSHQLAVAAFVAAEHDLTAWREAVVAKRNEEPLNIREATVGGSDERTVTTTEGV